jgi:uncharacterized protein
MPAEPVLSVRGEAYLEVDPEIAIVWVTVMARDKDRNRSVDLLAKRSGLVTGAIKKFGEAVEKLESGQVSVRPEFSGGKPRERITGYVAQANLTVTIADFAILGDLVADVAGQELVAVTGPEWQLRQNSPVRRDARLAAAKDAMERAREYAEAFGGTITGLVEAADAGLLAPDRQPQRFVFSSRAAAATAPQSSPEFDFEPAKQTVTAQVEARFTMTAPSFGQ